MDSCFEEGTGEGANEMFVDCVVGKEDVPAGAGLGAMIDVGLSVADTIVALVVVGASVSDSIATTVVGARAADGGEVIGD